MNEGVGGFRIPQGCQCVSGIAQGFDYYSPPAVEGAQVGFHEEKILPKNGLATDPYEFNFEASPDSFLCLNGLTLYCKAKIVKGDGGNIPSTAKVSTVNNLLGSLWSSIETRVNNITLDPPTGYNVAHKAYLETILSYEETRMGAVKAGGFAMDTATYYDNITDTNLGWKARQKTDSNEFDLCGSICTDMLRADNHLAPGNRLTLVFTRHADGFVLLSNDAEKYKIVITELAIFARRVHLNKSAFAAAYKQGVPQRYLTAYTEIKEFPLASGLIQWSGSVNHGGKIPKQIIVALVETAAMVGAYKKNPYNFQNFGVKQINLKINGAQVPSDPLKPDFDGKKYAREFTHLFRNTGKYRVNSGNCISWDSFAGGCAIYPFDLTPDQCNGFHTHAGKEGTVDIEIEWNSKQDTPITVLAYIASDQVVMLNGEFAPPTSSVF